MMMDNNEKTTTQLIHQHIHYMNITNKTGWTLNMSWCRCECINEQQLVKKDSTKLV